MILQLSYLNSIPYQFRAALKLEFIDIVFNLKLFSQEYYKKKVIT